MMNNKIPNIEDYKALLFDMDGTLLDSMGLWRQIDIDYLGRFGHSLPEDLQKCIEGKSFVETAIYIKERFTIPDSIEKMMDDWNKMAYQIYRDEVELKESVWTFLMFCKEKGLKMGVATSNSRELVDVIVKKFSFDQIFDYILTASEVKRGKPSPDIYLKVAEELKVEPKDCLVFEDVIPGIMAGKNAGMKVCGVEDTYSAEIREKKRELSDYYLDSFAEIVK